MLHDFVAIAVLLTVAYLAFAAIKAFIRSIDWKSIARGGGENADSGADLDGAVSAEKSASRGAGARKRNISRLFFADATLFRSLAFVLLTRVAFYALAYAFAALFRSEERGFFESLAALWDHSDAPHYEYIAENGYTTQGDAANRMVFLPFFPLVMRAVASVTGDYFWAGVIVSTASFMLACAVIYGIARRLGAEQREAATAVKFMAIFPASFFTNAPMSEGLFLLTTALCFLWLLDRRWIMAGIAGLMASFTRYYGILLVAPFLIEYAQSRCGIVEQSAAQRAEPSAGQSAEPSVEPSVRADAVSRGDWRRSALGVAGLVAGAWPALLVPLGTALYLLVNYAVTGDPFRFLVIQREHWSQSFGIFFDNIGDLLMSAITWDRVTSITLFVPQIILIGCALALLVYGARSRFRLSMQVYLLAYVVVSASATWMLSFPRYLFGAAPVFLLMGKFTSQKRNGDNGADACVTTFCCFLLVYLMAAFITGYHIY